MNNIFLITLLILVFSQIEGKTQIIEDTTQANYKEQKNFIECLLKKITHRHNDEISNIVILDNKISFSEYINTLNNLFETDLYSKFNIIKGCDYNVYQNNDLLLNISILEFGFVDGMRAEELNCINNIKNVSRFNSKVWIEFRTIKKDNNLIFIISKTPLSSLIKEIFSNPVNFFNGCFH